MPSSINTYRRSTARVGWLALFSGESQGKALRRAIRDLNADGYRVAFIVPDHYSFFGRVFNLLPARRLDLWTCRG